MHRPIRVGGEIDTAVEAEDCMRFVFLVQIARKFNDQPFDTPESVNTRNKNDNATGTHAMGLLASQPSR